LNNTSFIKEYIKNPFPLWGCEVTEVLIAIKWDELRKSFLLDSNEYSTENAYKKTSNPIGDRFTLLNPENQNLTYLESPSFEGLRDFYQQHGLEPYSTIEIKSNEVLTKLNSALALLNVTSPLLKCVGILVRAIQVLKSSDPEIDISYSHPDIPFSIFVSICNDDSIISNLRVAESIVHEAMHLKLSLLENAIPLVKPNATGLFYSPWREEKRPAQGVLHGLFVFRAILDFLYAFERTYPNQGNDYLFIRKETINKEISQLKSLAFCEDLTKDGQELASRLL
jgi:HEXXH motif-containing protein